MFILKTIIINTLWNLILFCVYARRQLGAYVDRSQSRFGDAPWARMESSDLELSLV